MAAARKYLVLSALFALVFASLGLAGSPLAEAKTDGSDATVEPQQAQVESETPTPAATPQPEPAAAPAEKPAQDKPAAEKPAGTPAPTTEKSEDVKSVDDEEVTTGETDEEEIPEPKNRNDGDRVEFGKNGLPIGLLKMASSRANVPFACDAGDIYAVRSTGDIYKYQYKANGSNGQYYPGWGTLFGGFNTFQSSTQNPNRNKRRADSVNGIAAASPAPDGTGNVYGYFRSYDAYGNWYITPVVLNSDGNGAAYITKGGTSTNAKDAQYFLAANGIVPIAGTIDPVSGNYLFGGYRHNGRAMVLDLYMLDLGAGSVRQLATIDTGNSHVRDLVNSNGSKTATNANGDIAFDANGNLYVLRHATKETHAVISTVTAAQMQALRDSGYAGTLTQPGTRVEVAVPGVSQAHGIALNPDGTVALSGSTTQGAAFVKNLDPVTGTFKNTVAGNASGITDLASCMKPDNTNTLTIKKAVPGGRISNSDQFTLQAKSSGGNDLGKVTTTGSGDTVNGQLGPILLAAGSKISLSEVAAGTANLSRYDSSLSCTVKVDEDLAEPVAGDLTVVAAGTSGTLQVPGDAKGHAYVCTFENRKKDPKPNTLQLKKEIVGDRFAEDDNFKIEIAQNGGGLGSAQTVGSAVTAQTEKVTVEAGKTYDVKETALGGGDLGNYSTTLSCTGKDPNGVSVRFTAARNQQSGTVTIPSNAGGMDAVCTFTNKAGEEPPPVNPPGGGNKLTLKKVLGSARVNDGGNNPDQFRMGVQSPHPPWVNYSWDTKGSGSEITADYAARTEEVVAGGTYKLYEIKSPGSVLGMMGNYNTTFSCVGTDSNGKEVAVANVALTGDERSAEVTIPADADGLDTTCTFTNTDIDAPPPAKRDVVLGKWLPGGLDPATNKNPEAGKNTGTYNDVFDWGYMKDGAPFFGGAQQGDGYYPWFAGASNSSGSAMIGGPLVEGYTWSSGPQESGAAGVPAAGKFVVGSQLTLVERFSKRPGTASSVPNADPNAYVSELWCKDGDTEWVDWLDGPVWNPLLGEKPPTSYPVNHTYQGADGYWYRDITVEIPAGADAYNCVFVNTPGTPEPPEPPEGGVSLVVKKNLPGDGSGRVKNGDQFELSISQGSEVKKTATTTGNSNGVQTVVAELDDVKAGDTYTWSEAAAGSTNMAHYSPTGECKVNGTGQAIADTSITGQLSGSVTIPGNLQASDKVVCTFANTISAEENDFTLVKVDERGSTLEGAEFEMWYDADGSGEMDGANECDAAGANTDAWNGTATTDANGVITKWETDSDCTTSALHPFLDNKYLIKETAAPDGFELDSTVHEITIGDGENELEVVNKRNDDGKVTWEKIDGDDKGTNPNRLGGSEWILTNPKGETTIVKDCVAANASACEGPDKNPAEGAFEVELSGHDQGKYTLKEYKAPAGFVLSDTVYEIDFKPKENGTDYQFGRKGSNGEITNERIGLPDIPLTGGASRDAFMIVSGGILVAALVGGALDLRRRKQDLVTN